MSETKQTRCPFCNSVFNITDAQLAARGGHVRCGSCLQVFRADQNLVAGTPAPAAPAATRPAPPPPPPAESPSSSLPVVARTQSATAAAEDKPISQLSKKKKKLEDESWAFNLIGDEAGDDTGETPDTPAAPPPAPAAPAKETASAPAAPKSKKPLFDDELSDMLHEAWQEQPSKSGHQLSGPGEVDKIKEAADDSWAQALLSEIAEEEKKEQAKNYSMEVVNSKTGKAPSTTPVRKGGPEPEEAPPRAKRAPEPPREREKAATGGNSDDDLLNFLNSNSAPTLSQNTASLPVEIRHQKHLSIKWGYYITWSVLCLLALLALIGQYVFFNFDRLSVNADSRPRMLALCEALKCKVPEPPDVSLLRLQKLVVRKHPDVENALQIDVLLYNKATFTQPLPALKLILTNKKGEVVAGRLFVPRDYLPRDFSNLRRIPPDTPIHIELGVQKPGAPFSGYQMQPVL